VTVLWTILCSFPGSTFWYFVTTPWSGAQITTMIGGFYAARRAGEGPAKWAGI
jgi:hypothetical protein